MELPEYRRLIRSPPEYNDRDEGIVLNLPEKGKKAMSAHLILGLEKVPRVGLFAH